MVDKKPTVPLGPRSGPIAFGTALAQKDSRTRHSAITSDLYSFTGYKVWKAKNRNAFEQPK